MSAVDIGYLQQILLDLHEARMAAEQATSKAKRLEARIALALARMPKTLQDARGDVHVVQD